MDLQNALDESDLDALATLLRQHSHLVNHRVEGANGQSYTPLQYVDRIDASLDTMRLLVEFGANLSELNEALFGCCENHNLEHMQRLLKLGVPPRRRVQRRLGLPRPLRAFADVPPLVPRPPARLRRSARRSRSYL